ncbi:MAG: hypothetical protein K5656_08875 [Lachnospiraceae bacterium]|nr:hypothetical protein [Lachnospiraceae bacterium]
MIGWSFPSRNNGETEGFANAGMEFFKGNPLRALAREVCQNSLDAQRDEDKPVCVEFEKKNVRILSFPGMSQLGEVLKKCSDYWSDEDDEKAQVFLKRAFEELKSGDTCVLRISDFNTTGLEGPYSQDDKTPWNGLVKGASYSVKTASKTAAGSFGIGKAATFINSKYHTTFYRTKNIQNEDAVQGVARLMAFSDESYGDADPVRRSIGYYGEPDGNLAVSSLPGLDQIYKRTEVGTDIFVPGFKFDQSGKNDWVKLMIGEVLENFLMAIEYRNLEVNIAGNPITKKELKYVVASYQKYAKDAFCFNKVLTADSSKVIDEAYDFHRMGKLRLRLLYEKDLNNKILVVRKSGMKVSEIGGLPKGFSYSGILELQGDELNSFFRNMENPTHDKWEPDRHSNPSLAKEYKREVEEWVKDIIRKKASEMAGEEVYVDTANLFNTTVREKDPQNKNENGKEGIINTTYSIEVAFTTKKTSTVRRNSGAGKKEVSGTIDDVGDLSGHRHRDGKRSQTPKGRKGRADSEGKDRVFAGMKTIETTARVIGVGDGVSRLICTPQTGISKGVIQLYATGENGKSIPIHISSLETGTNGATLENGKIVLNEVKEHEKVVIDFRISGDRNYAMGVEFSGN